MTRVQEIDSLKKQVKQSKSESEVALQKQLTLEQQIVEKDQQIEEFRFQIENASNQQAIIGENQNKAIAELAAHKTFAIQEIKDLTTKLINAEGEVKSLQKAQNSNSAELTSDNIRLQQLSDQQTEMLKQVTSELKNLQLKLATIEMSHSKDLEEQAKRYEDKLSKYDQVKAS